MNRRLALKFSAVLLLAGCASQPLASPPYTDTREGYLEWRAAHLLRAEPKVWSFAEVALTPEGEWPGHLQGRTITFAALFLSTEEIAVDSIAGRTQRLVQLGDPQRSDRNARFALDAEDYAEDSFRFDNLAARSGEWRGTPVKVTAHMTGVPEDPAFSPWIGRILRVEADPGS